VEAGFVKNHCVCRNTNRLNYCIMQVEAGLDRVKYSWFALCQVAITWPFCFIPLAITCKILMVCPVSSGHNLAFLFHTLGL